MSGFFCRRWPPLVCLLIVFAFAAAVVAAITPRGDAATAGRPDPVTAFLAGRPAAVPRPALLTSPADLPARWDWREQGGVTPAKDFWPCNATWCFSAVAAVEAAVLINEGITLDLSEQQVLACATPGAGCSGAWMEEAYRYIRDHGVTTEACFPYTGSETTTCWEYDCTSVAGIAGWLDIPNDVEALKTAILNGPVSSVLLIPAEFPWYDGTYCLEGSPSTSVYVAVLMAGWDDALCENGAWICKANNGPDWGDEGFFYIGYGENGIGAHAQRPLYSPADRVHAFIENSFDGLVYGDGDTFAEPGETFLIFLGLRNGWVAPTRTDLTATASLVGGPADCPPVEISFGGPIPPGTILTTSTEIPVAVDRTAVPGSEFQLEIRSRDAGVTVGVDTFTVAVGQKTVLVVDDDEGDWLDQWFTESLARTDYPFDRWDESHRGPVSRFEMERYDAVIWLTGLLGRIENEDMVAINYFTDGGGNLFITGQDIGWYLNEDFGNRTTRNFYRRVLLAEYLADDSGYSSVQGTAGSGLGEGLTFTIGGSGGSGSQNFPSLVLPRENAFAPLEYAPGLAAAVQDSSRGKLLYCAFGFEAIDQQAARDTLLARTLNWMAGPAPDQSPPQLELLAPVGGESFLVGSEVTIHWRGQDNVAVLYYQVEHSFDSGASWPEQIGFAAGTDSQLAWTACDSVGNQHRLRVLATDGAGLCTQAVMAADFSVIAMPEVPLPSIPLTLLPNVPNPFNGETEIRFVLAAAAPSATVSIFDLRGKLVFRQKTGPLDAGTRSVSWDGRDLAGRRSASGTYGYRVEIPGATATGCLSLVK